MSAKMHEKGDASDIVQIIPEKTKKGFVCVTSNSRPKAADSDKRKKMQRDLRLFKEIEPRIFLWYSYTDKSFITINQDTQEEKFVHLKCSDTDYQSISDIVMHPNLF